MTITRAHLEEDTAKLVHATDAAGRRVSLVDFNRSGAPLMEIVTEPDIRTAEQARRYAEELQLLLRSIGASDADMERGQLRVEANVSLRPRGTEPFGTRVEVKNMNSFRAVERAIAFEIERQAAALDAGEPVVQETRGWSEERGSTYRMRIKETSDDYRYFPEPDLPPLHLDPAWLAELRDALPELPGARRRRYRDVARADRIRRRRPRGRSGGHGLFEATLAADPGLDAKAVANWVTRRLPSAAKRRRVRTDDRARRTGGHHRRGPRGFDLAGAGSRGARRPRCNRQGRRGDHRRTRFRQISDAGALTAAVAQVLADNPAAVADYRAGKAQAVGFLVGQVMKATRGQANAALAQSAVREQLESGETRRPERVSPLNVVLWVGGAALIFIGYTRARGPWSRYQALKAQDQNIARYEAWRGGVRDDGTTGASVAMEILRRQAQMAGLIAVAGFVLVFLGFLVSADPAASAATRSWCSDPSPRRGRRRAAIRAASQLTTPSCSQRHRAPAATASWAWGGAQLRAPEDVDHVERPGRRHRLGERRGTPATPVHLALVRD